MYNHPDRRREPRFEVGGHALVRLEAGHESYHATVVNVSGGGLFLKLEAPHPFKVGDEVTCEIALPSVPQQPFASWGLGRVVRVDSTGAAIELHVATFVPNHRAG